MAKEASTTLISMKRVYHILKPTFAVLLGLLTMTGCPVANAPDVVSTVEPAIPHGYMDRLEQMHDGQMIGFGPFVGYYFRPDDPRDLSRLQFVCFNENRFYSSDMPDGAKLYEGEAVRTALCNADIALAAEERINPIFFENAPEAWRKSRPRPRDEFLHFHSCYNGAGPVRTGYWIRHVAVAAFTYDMGGKVGSDSRLHHKVQKGPDRNFARIIEFDSGPREERP